MKDKLLTKTRLGQFEAAEWKGENLSGINPIGDQVLVLPDKAPDKTSGGVFVGHLAETQSLAAESGVLVAVGDGAWSWNMDRTRRFEGNKPKIGDRVCFVRYSGTEAIGDDGETYRICSDSSITGIRSAKIVKNERAA